MNCYTWQTDDELGYSKYDHKNRDTDNSRNSHSSKTPHTQSFVNGSLIFRNGIQAENVLFQAEESAKLGL